MRAKKDLGSIVEKLEELRFKMFDTITVEDFKKELDVYEKYLNNNYNWLKDNNKVYCLKHYKILYEQKYKVMKWELE